MTVPKHIKEHEMLGIAAVKKGDGTIEFYIEGTKVAELDTSGNFKIGGDFYAGESF
jgi:hypothetical protein